MSVWEGGVTNTHRHTLTLGWRVLTVMAATAMNKHRSCAMLPSAGDDASLRRAALSSPMYAPARGFSFKSFATRVACVCVYVSDLARDLLPYAATTIRAFTRGSPRLARFLPPHTPSRSLYHTLSSSTHTRSLVQLQLSPARLSFFPGRYGAAMGGVGGGGGGGDGDDDGGGGREKARLSLICVVPGSILRCLAETP